MTGTKKETSSEEIRRLKHDALLEAAMSDDEEQLSDLSQTELGTSFTQLGQVSSQVEASPFEGHDSELEYEELIEARPGGGKAESPPRPRPQRQARLGRRSSFLGRAFHHRDSSIQKVDQHASAQVTVAQGNNSRTMSYQSDVGSTQPYSQLIDQHPSYGETRSRHAQARPAEFRAARDASTESTGNGDERTYTTDGTGHVQLTGSDKPTSAKQVTIVEEEEDHVENEEQLLEEEFNLETQSMTIASQFPDNKRFKTPKTPASRELRGIKRARNGRILTPGSAPPTTPRPVNPFGGVNAGNQPVMSLSQAFNATQALSSPIPNALHSDAISERPSPHLGDVGRPNTAPASSSPAKSLETPLLRSEPYTRYTPLRESQEERERKGKHSSPQAEDIDDDDAFLDDDFAVNDSPVAKKTSRQMSAATRQKLAGITAEVRSPENKRKRRRDGSTGVRGRGRRKTIEPRPSSSTKGGRQPQVASKLQTPPVMRDEGDQDHSATAGGVQTVDSPTEQEPTGSRQTEAEMDEHLSVQVPRTISKRRQIMNMDTHSPASARRTEYTSDGAQSKAAVMSSQSAKRNEKQAETRDLSHISSLPNEGVVVQSQVPDSTGVAQQHDNPSALPRPKASAPSQQTATPPSSSPSPKRQVTAKGLDSTKFRPAPEPEHSVEADSDDDLTSPGIHANSSPELPTTLPETNLAETNAAEEPSEPLEPEPEPEPEMQPPSTPESAQAGSGAGRKLRRPKKFGQILTQQSSITASPTFDFDISAITAEDEEFQQRLGQDRESSPEMPARRKRRSALRNVPSTNVAAPAPSLEQVEGETEPRELRNTRSTTPKGSRFAATPEPPASEKENQPNLQKQNEPTQKHNKSTQQRKRRAVDPAPDTEATSGALAQDPPASTISEPVQPASRKRPRTESWRQQQRKELDQQSTESGLYAPESPLQIPMADDGDIYEPTMVWAHFNGIQQKGYYPARCLGPAENNKLRVRFDDGNEALVPSATVRSLELRVGDLVKIDGKETKANTYVVRELADKQLSRPPATQMQSFSDINGWTKVRLVMKGSDDVAAEEELVSVTMLYLTQTLFNNLKDRPYTHPTDANSARTQTPSVSGSIPPTPLSNRRRLKTSIKKESMLRQSYRASANQDGLFAGMAFAVTSVDQKKRQQMERQVEDNGGTLLVEGFRGLFHMPEKSSLQSSDGAESTTFAPNEQASTYGFSALLTENHCRTSTYLHALALNIPCLSICWIKDCLAADKVLDWRPYLLPSGESLVLEGAVRSRVMEVPVQYSSSASVIHWPLCSMVDSRAQPMAGAKIILVSDRAIEKETDAHLFIAYALGASRVALAQGWKRAEAYLKESKHGWDWICCPDEVELGASQKGRKRKSGVLDLAGEMEIKWKQGVRVVKPEFVLQSLVSGRLVSQ